jgi:hypothetical protein
MNSNQTALQSVDVSREKLLGVIGDLLGERGGREDDEHPLPPGPWDPVIRVAFERLNTFGPRASAHLATSFGPGREPWRIILANILARHPEIFDALGGGHSFGDEVSLNPQPLPPRYAFLIAAAQTVISRAELLQEFADSTRRQGEERAIIIVGGITSRFSDDWCGTGFKLKYPFPGPRPHWFASELSGIDLVVIASQFEEAARQSFSPDLRQSLANASAKFVDAGLSRMR